MFNRKKELKLILQRFVRPQNDQNSKKTPIQLHNFLLLFFDFYLQLSTNPSKLLNSKKKIFNPALTSLIDLIFVQWTPQICHITKKMNRHSLGQRNIPKKDLLSTFDGPIKNCISEPVRSNVVNSDLEKICLNIVKHVQQVSEGNSQISRMELVFKIGHKNKLWLLMCTNLKLREPLLSLKPQRTDPLLQMPKTPILRLVEYPDVEYQAEKEKTLKINNGLMMSTDLKKQVYCSSCLAHEILYPVRMKEVFIWRGENTKDKVLGLVVKRVWGKDGFGNIDSFVRQSTWLETKTKFCLKCYLSATKHLVDRSEYIDPKVDQASNMSVGSRHGLGSRADPYDEKSNQFEKSRIEEEEDEDGINDEVNNHNSEGFSENLQKIEN